MIRSSDSICREEDMEHQLASAGGNDPIHIFFCSNFVSPVHQVLVLVSWKAIGPKW